MKRKIHALTLLTVFILGLVGESCNKAAINSDVEPTEPVLPIKDILDQIYSATTLDETKAGIENLLTKTGIGNEDTNGSKYQYYTLSEEEINEIAINQFEYLNVDTINAAITINGYLNLLISILDTSSFVPVNIRDVEHMYKLIEDEVSFALTTKETPDNSVLVGIFSENGELPDINAPLDTSIVIDPLQTFLCTIWFLDNLEHDIYRKHRRCLAR